MRAASLLLVGCATVSGPPAGAPYPGLDGVAACAAPTLAVGDDACADRFTVDGVPCVACPVGTGCYDVATATYCTAGGCGDTRCSLRRSPR